MKRYALSHLSNEQLLRSLAAVVVRERTATADVLAHIAEVDERRLYLPAGYPSMFAYCVGELRLSEDAAAKRIHAARVARRFPEIFEALAAGHLHLTGIGLLAPHLTESTAGELLASAAGKTKTEIELLLAERFPQSGLLAWVASAVPGSPSLAADQHAPAHVDCPVRPSDAQVEHARAQVGGPSSVAPLSAHSFALRVTMTADTHRKLGYARDLLGHQVPSGDLAAVLDRVLDLAIAQLEKQKFAATSRPRQRRGRPSSDSRHIPAEVRRAVWERDEGRCTFVSDSGHRCEAQRGLEFDHIQEVARGGEATVGNLRLRCRGHNQFAAEHTFGAEFMRHKRSAAAESRSAATQACASAAQTGPADMPQEDVVPWLRALGLSLAEASRGAERCADMPDASLEERVRAALGAFRPRATPTIPAGHRRDYSSRMNVPAWSSA